MALMMTLLMVVGCDVSPNLDTSIPEGCVNVKLNIVDGRQLDVSSTVPNEITDWKYNLIPLWEYDEDQVVSEPIHGEVYMGDLVDNNIGWVTPGFWKVQVYGIYAEEGNGFVIIYYGETEVYFNENNTNAIIYMKPFEWGDLATITIEITQPNLSESNTDYYYCYSIKGVSGENAVERNGILNKDKTSTNKYGITESNLKADYYTINISIYRNKAGLTDFTEVKKDAELVGGEVVGIVIHDGATVTVSGTVNPSDFVQGQLIVSSVNVKGVMNRGFFSAADDGIATSFEVIDNTVITGNKTYTHSYQWYVNGVLMQDGDNKAFSHTFKKYGPKEVSCVIVYKSGTEVYSATVKETFTLTPSASV